MNKKQLTLAIAAAGITVGAITLGLSSSIFSKDIATEVFVNGTIYTANESQESVDVLAIKDDKIIYAGNKAGADQYITETTKVIDLDGRMIMPGLHDTHVHPLLALEAETCALPSQNEYDLNEVITTVKACLVELGDKAPQAGEWITVSQYNGYGADSPEFLGGFPDIATGLDTISTTHKLIMIGLDGHAYAVNHYALENAAKLNGTPYAITAENMAGPLSEYTALIPFNDQNLPNGQLKSQASWDLFKYETTTVDEFIERKDEINNYFLSNGITSAQEAWAHGRDVDVYSKLANQGDLLPRISLSLVVKKDTHKGEDGKVDIDLVMKDVNSAQVKANGSNRLKVDSVKLMVDGVIEYPTQTAAVFEPYLSVDIHKDGTTDYHDQAHDKINRGLLEMEPTEINDLVMSIDQAGYSAHFHAIGDRAVDIALTAVEKARAANPKSDAPHNIAHLQLVRPEDIPRFGAAGVFATPTPAWFAPWHSYDLSVAPYINKIKNTHDFSEFYDANGKYISNLYPVESIRKNGGIISIGSDAPIDFKGPRPFTNIMYGLLRGEWITDPPTISEEDATDDDYSWVVMNKEERMTIRDLIDAYTINGAKALQQADIVGSLEAGKQADFIIVNNDIIKMAESVTTTEDGEDTETAYLICDIAWEPEYCGTEVLSTYIDGKRVYQK